MRTSEPVFQPGGLLRLAFVVVFSTVMYFIGGWVWALATAIQHLITQ